MLTRVSHADWVITGAGIIGDITTPAERGGLIGVFGGGTVTEA
jgi:hypothetical protein